MKRALFSTLCVLVLVSGVASNASAQVHFMMGFDGAAGGSWTRSLALAWSATVAPYGFDEIRLAYRPDLDLGGGTFESPFMSYFRDGGPFPGSVNFAGPERFDWSAGPSGATYARATGTTLSGTWLPFRVHHSGDMNFETGFSYAWYLDGNYVDSGALHWSGTTGGFLDRSQQEWEQDWAAAVPEPTTLTVLGLGLAGAVVMRRRKPKA